jgi:hypothetical protein
MMKASDMMGDLSGRLSFEGVLLVGSVAARQPQNVSDGDVSFGGAAAGML